MKVMTNTITKKRFSSIQIYYLILSLPFLLLNMESEPPVLFRLAYLTALVFPVFYSKEICFPAILTFFMSVSFYGFSYALLPYELSYYLIIALIAAYFVKGKAFRLPRIFYFLFFYVLLIDSLTHSSGPFFNKSFFCYLITVFFSFSIRDIDESKKQFEISFILITIFLSVLFFMGRNQYQFDYNAVGAEDLTRVVWFDPNYLGCIIGMGTCIALSKVMTTGGLGKFERIMCLMTIAISIPVLLLNASRGAVLAVAGSFIVLLFFSKIKLIYKILIIALSFAFLFYLFNQGFFDLLVFRFVNDDSIGSHRGDIWAMKLKMFVNGNPLSMIFGYGLVHGQNISGKNVGFHNDFLSYLVCYGVIGFCLLISVFVSIFKKRKFLIVDKARVVCSVVYLILCFMTLEPLSSGFFPYFVFFMYILILSKSASLNLKVATNLI